MVEGVVVGVVPPPIEVQEKSDSAESAPPAEDTSIVCSLSADAFLGKWTTSVGQNVLVERRSEDTPNVLKAILTKGTNPELQLTIKLDNRQWCCGNGVLVLDSTQEHPNEISWMKWSGGVTTWTRKSDSWSDVVKSCKPEDSAVEPKDAEEKVDPKDAEEKLPSTTKSSSGKRVVSGLAAEDFLGHWKWQEHDVIVSYLEGSNGRLQVTISNRSQPLVLGLTKYHGADYWLCGNGYLNDNIEYDVDNKQAKSLQWVYLNERTHQVVMSNWTRVTDNDSTTKKSVSDSDGGSTDEGAEDKVGTWYEETLDWENQQCNLKTKILGKQGKTDTPKATRTTQEKNAQSQAHQWAKGWVDVTNNDRKTRKPQQAQWENHQWVQPQWGNATGNNFKNQKTQQAKSGGRNKTGWREVDGWKHEANNSRSGGRGQQKATKQYQ